MKYIAKKQNGFSTLEIMLAMVILIFALTVVVLVSFGNQTMLTDSQTNTEALNIAQEVIEQQQALSRKDFNLVNPSVSTNGLYTTTIGIQQTDVFTKNVTAAISWKGEHNRNLTVSLSTIVTNFTNALGGNTCYSTLSPNAEVWKSPHLKNANTNFASLAGVSGSYPITDMDVYQDRLYVTVGATPVNTDPTLFIFDVSNPQSPVFKGKIDNAASTNAGLNAVAVSDYVDSGGNNKIYAYVASARPISAAADFGQLQVIDVTDWQNPFVVSSGTYKIPGVNGTSGQGIGNSMFYSNGFVYLGLTLTGSGPEFNIIDVHDPQHPNIVTGGTYNTGNGINAVAVRGQYAYLATPNSSELTILNIANPGSPTLAGSFNAAGSGNGKSLYLYGDKLFLGRTSPSAGPEFYILNNADPSQFTANNPSPQTITISNSVDGVIARSGLDTATVPQPHSLVILLTRTNFQLWDTADLSPWTPNKNISEFFTLPASGSAVYEPVMDCERNYFYVAANNTSNQSYLYVIAP